MDKKKNQTKAKNPFKLPSCTQIQQTYAATAL